MLAENKGFENLLLRLRERHMFVHGSAAMISISLSHNHLFHNKMKGFVIFYLRALRATFTRFSELRLLIPTHDNIWAWQTTLL